MVLEHPPISMPFRAKNKAPTFSGVYLLKKIRGLIPLVFLFLNVNEVS